jgi:hypothetical protein
MNQTFLSLAVLALAAAPLAAQANPCRDAKGHFMSCIRTGAAKPAVHPPAAHPLPAARPVAVVHPAAIHPVVAHPVQAPAVHPAVVAGAKTAPRRCRVGNRFASCKAPGAKPA